MVDLQRERSRAMLEASINVVPSCFKSFPRTSLHRVRGAPRGLDQYRSVNAKVKHKLQTAQNKMIRYLLNYWCRRHIGFSDFKKSNCLDINARVDYMSLNLMFNIFNNVAPSYMCDINRISHRHNTRQSDSAYVVPGVKGQGSKSFKFNGSKLWNELPTNVKHVQQKIRFKKECKALLMTRMNEKKEMNVVS